MVAAAKLRKAQAAAEAARPYAERLEGVVASLASKVGGSDSAPQLLAGTGKSDTHLLVVLNSDRGLAGAFNSNIVKARARQGARTAGTGQEGSLLPDRPQGPSGHRTPVRGPDHRAL